MGLNRQTLETPAVAGVSSEDAVLAALGPWKPWYRYRWPYALRVLKGRIRNRRPRPVFRGRMMWQRAQRGWSEEDVWGLDRHLALVIRGSVRRLREIAHGYPTGITYERWLEILREIEEGMDAVIARDDWRDWRAAEADWEARGKAQFERAMAHLTEWWGALWD